MVGIGPSGHALAHACLGESLAEGVAGVLAAAIAVEDGAAGGAGLKGLMKRVEDEIGAKVVGETPADDARLNRRKR